jgi:glycosyltransferase involved in cell wall biosynthesis
MESVGGLMISVIMLTFNRESLVGRAIESILHQTFHDYEFIIIDNGSTDHSGVIADEYAKRDNRIHVIHREQGNIGSGRNVGLDIANGEYITFIDDDDYVEPDFLRFLYDLARNHDADIATCGSYQDQNGVISPNWILVYNECFVMNAERAIEVFLQRKLYNAAMPTKLIKRNLTDKIRFDSKGNYDDISTTYKYFANAETVVAQGLPKYTFSRHDGNNSSAATKHHLLNPVQLSEYFNAYRERTEYISNLFPSLHSLARYRELAYMVSMVEKIYRFGLKNCNEPLEFMKKEIRNSLDEFLCSGFCEDFEREWVAEYVGIPNYTFSSFPNGDY